MKTLKYSWILFIAMCTFFSCEEKYELNTDIKEVGALMNPVSGTPITIDVENGSNVVLEWSPAKSADGGLILYKVLFDKEGGNFENPIYSLPSDNKGGSNALTLSPVILNIIAANAGLEQLTPGKVIWTVEASSSYQTQQFSDNFELLLTRPEGFAIFPQYMYIYGTATEAADVANGVAFKEIVNELPTDNFTPGIFESITSLKGGEYFITDSNNPDSVVNTYHVNEEGKIRSGNTPTAFTLEEGVYWIRMDLSTATISFKKISDLQLYILASDKTKANLTYVGNHTFEAKDAFFDFLKPGDPEAPSWLGWEEERYRFRFLVDGVQSYIGSYMNEAMNGSLVEGQEAYNVRPNGEEPGNYYNIYFHGEEAPYWQGAYKFADKYNGKSFTVRIVFDPKADHYYHEFKLN